MMGLKAAERGGHYMKIEVDADYGCKRMMRLKSRDTMLVEVMVLVLARVAGVEYRISELTMIVPRPGFLWVWC
jgi:hypothetical protein